MKMITITLVLWTIYAPVHLERAREEKEQFLKKVKRVTDLVVELWSGPVNWGDGKGGLVEEAEAAYEDCLSTRLRGLVEWGPLCDTVGALEGASLALPCALCPPPSAPPSPPLWLHTPSLDLPPGPLESPRAVQPQHEFRLRLFKVRLEDRGFYWCQRNGELSEPIYVHVASDEVQPILEVFGSPLPSPPRGVVWEWGEWTECSRCGGPVGRRWQVGECRSAGVKEARGAFRGGLHPCGSPLAPSAGPYVVRSALCRVPCLHELFRVRENKGTVLEEANHSQGVFSLLEGIVPKALPVVVSRIHGTIGSQAKLECPGTSLRDIPPEWTDPGGVPLVDSSLSNLTAGRIRIDALSRIKIKEVVPEDQFYFYCWEGGVLVGAVRLTGVGPTGPQPAALLSLFLAALLVWGAFKLVKRHMTAGNRSQSLESNFHISKGKSDDTEEAESSPLLLHQLHC